MPNSDPHQITTHLVLEGLGLGGAGVRIRQSCNHFNGGGGGGGG